MDRNLLTFVALGLAAGSLFWSWRQEEAIRGIDAKLQELAEGSFDEKCGNAAAAELERQGRKKSENLTYRYFYNPGLKRCFLKVVATGSSSQLPALFGNSYISLYDVYQKRLMAQFTPDTCLIYPDTGQGNPQKCKSEQEFEAFVTRYITEAEPSPEQP